MSVVTVENEALNRLLPNDEEEWTVDDLARMPDDGFRYELFDGVLVVSPSPFMPHQRAARALFRLLDHACPPELEYATSGVDNYWIFDPKALEFVALARDGVRYDEVAGAKGDERIVVEQPYRVEICPAEIAAG